MQGHEICKAVSGVLTGEKTVAVQGVCTDSRKIYDGCLFVALRGERFDGNHFIADAFATGAAVVIGNVPYSPPAGKAYIQVADTTIALGQLAAWHRNRYSLPVVGVTGSVGKTTTKEMIAAVLAEKYHTLKTAGNYNNAIGLPLTLFNLTAAHGAAVIEMGMSNLGEIAYLTQIAKPTVAVITNIGLCHIENLKTMENTCRAKLEIAEGLPKGGTLFVNGDDSMLAKVQLEEVCVMRYGFENADNEIRGEITGENSFQIDGITFSVPIGGKHNLYNALAAYCVGKHCGVSAEKVVQGIQKYQTDGIRQSEIEIRPGITVLCDYYNASPASVKVALAMLQKGDAKRRIAVLGDMLELGTYSESCHREIGREVLLSGTDMLLTVGKEMQYAAEEAAGRIPTKTFEDNESLSAYLLSVLTTGDKVLIKGSHGMKMEEIFEKIR